MNNYRILEAGQNKVIPGIKDLGIVIIEIKGGFQECATLAINKPCELSDNNYEHTLRTISYSAVVDGYHMSIKLNRVLKAKAPRPKISELIESRLATWKSRVIKPQKTKIIFTDKK